MAEAFLGPWPWYVSGPLIGLTVPLLLLLAGKPLGISGSFQYLCALAAPRRKDALGEGAMAPDGAPEQAGPPKERWKAVFALGMAVGGLLAARVLSAGALQLFPAGYYSVAGAAQLLLGGFLVGFGSRYAAGCTSGHAIFGLSSLQLASLVAVAGFFAGGLAAAGITLLLFD